MSQKKRPRGDPNFTLESKREREARQGTWHACTACGRARHIAAALDAKSRLKCYGCKRQTTLAGWHSYPSVPVADVPRINALVKQIESQNRLSETLLHESQDFFKWVDSERKLLQLERTLLDEFPDVSAPRRATQSYRNIWSHHHHGTSPSGPLPHIWCLSEISMLGNALLAISDHVAKYADAPVHVAMLC